MFILRQGLHHQVPLTDMPSGLGFRVLRTAETNQIGLLPGAGLISLRAKRVNRCRMKK